MKRCVQAGLLPTRSFLLGRARVGAWSWLCSIDCLDAKDDARLRGNVVPLA